MFILKKIEKEKNDKKRSFTPFINERGKLGKLLKKEKLNYSLPGISTKEKRSKTEGRRTEAKPFFKRFRLTDNFKERVNLIVKNRAALRFVNELKTRHGKSNSFSFKTVPREKIFERGIRPKVSKKLVNKKGSRYRFLQPKTGSH